MLGENKRHWLIAIVFLVVAILAYFLFFADTSYTIPGVRPFTIFNEEAINSPIHRSEVAAAAVMLLRYWGEETDLNEAEIFFDQPNLGGIYESISNYVLKFGFTGKIVTLNKPDDLRRFINSKERTPLVVSLLISHPDSDRKIAYTFVIVGVDEKSRKIIAHNFYHGNNYEISFEDLEGFWQNVAPEFRHRYLVVTAPAGGLPTKNSSPDYPPRLGIMDSLKDVFFNLKAARVARGEDDFKSSELYYKKIIDDPHFDELAPWLRVALYSRFAETQMGLGKYSEAKKNLDIAQGMNHDLDKPYGEWPAYHLLSDTDGKIGLPYRIYGGYYRVIGDEKNAQNSFKKAEPLRLSMTDDSI